MIQEFVTKWEARKHLIEAKFREKHPGDYSEIVKSVVSVLADENGYGDMDAEKIHKIDDGDYQGTLLFIIPEKCYQPSKYWAVYVGYGSCSGCDTLQSINGYSDEKPTDEQVKEYMTLALHIVQGLKLIGD